MCTPFARPGVNLARMNDESGTDPALDLSDVDDITVDMDRLLAIGDPTITTPRPDLSALAVVPVPDDPFSLSESDPTPLAGVAAQSLRDLLRRARVSDDSAPSLRPYLVADCLGSEYTLVDTPRPTDEATSARRTRRRGRGD